MNSKLYVGNLAAHTTEDDLRNIFGEYGTIARIEIATDPATGRPSGFGFVTFGTLDEARIAIQRMHGHRLDGLALTVHEAEGPSALDDAHRTQDGRVLPTTADRTA